MITRREFVGLLPAGLFATSLYASLEAAAAPLTYTLKPIKLADGVWCIPGAQEAITLTNGGAIANISVLDTTEGAVIIDTGPSRKYGAALKGMATELTGKPVVRVYNTHFHPDHVMGNQAFPSEIIAAPKGVIDGLKAFGGGFADSMYRIAGDWMRGTEVVVPGTLLTADVEDFGSRRLRQLEMRGHTPSDLVLFDELSGFLFAGDLVFLDRAPTTPHADLERWQISLANLGGIPHQRLVPGHGPAEDNVRGLDQTRQWLDMLRQVVGDAFERGLDINEAILLPLPKWTEPIALARYEYERSVMHLYPTLETARWPRIDESN